MVQMLVAVSVIAIAVLSFATMMNHMTASQALVQARQDQFSVANEVMTLVYDQTSCTNALPPNTPFIPATAAGDFPNAQNFALQISPKDTLKTNGTLETYGLIINRFQVEKADLVGVDPAGKNIYLGRLVFQASPKSSQSGLSDFKPQRLGTAYFTVDNNKVLGCSSDAPTTLPSVIKNCQELGGVYNTTSKSCLLKPQPAACPAGQASSGFDANGAIKCIAVDTTVNDPQVATGSCPAGQFASGMTAQGKLICSKPTDAVTASDIDLGSLCKTLGGSIKGTKCTMENKACPGEPIDCGTGGCIGGMGNTASRLPVCGAGKWVCVCPY